MRHSGLATSGFAHLLAEPDMHLSLGIRLSSKLGEVRMLHPTPLVALYLEQRHLELLAAIFLPYPTRASDTTGTAVA